MPKYVAHFYHNSRIHRTHTFEAANDEAAKAMLTQLPDRENWGAVDSEDDANGDPLLDLDGLTATGVYRNEPLAQGVMIASAKPYSWLAADFVKKVALMDKWGGGDQVPARAMLNQIIDEARRLCGDDA